MTFFTDEYRCPAHAGDVAVAIADLAGRPDVTGPLNVAGPDVLSRAAFARSIANVAGTGSHTAHHVEFRNGVVDPPRADRPRHSQGDVARHHVPVGGEVFAEPVSRPTS